MLRPGHTTPAELRRLEREAEIMARLRHPGIAHVLEAGVERSGPYFMMEYVEGEPITRFARRRELPVEDRLRLFLLVCDAVQHAHAMGVIHRDLKPANILVTDAGAPKVLDFGVARAVDPEARPGTLATSYGQLVGTLAYMSPEQAGGNSAAIDTRADVYALGGILFELLAGMAPLHVHARPLHEALRVIQFEPAPRLGAHVREFRGDLETIVAKALEKDPARRYASVSELAGDIRRHLDHLPIHAHPPSTLYEVARFTRRHRSLVAAVAVALTAVVGWLGWVLVARHREHQDYLLAKSLSGSWLPDVMEALAPVPGTYAARLHMLEELREPLRMFAERHPDDPDAQANLAAWNASYASLLSDRADFENAIPCYQRAYSILERIVAHRPGDATWRLRQSTAAVRIGDILQARGRLLESQSWYRDALELDLESVRCDPLNYTAHDQLVWSFARLANTAIDQGRFDDAAEYTGRLEAAADAIIGAWPVSGERKYAFKALYCKIHALGTRAHFIEASQGRRAGLPWREQAMERSRELVRGEPNNKGYMIHHVFALAHMSNARLLDGRPDEALALLGESEVLVDRLLVLDPDERESQEAAVVHSSAVCDARQAANDIGGAIAALARAVDHSRELRRLEPHLPRTAFTALDMESRFAIFVSAHGTPREAAEAAAACRDNIRAAVRAFPAHPISYCILAELEFVLSSAGAGDRAAALDLARHAATLCTPEAPRDALRVGDLLVALDDQATAARVFALAARCSAEAKLGMSADERSRLDALAVAHAGK